MIKITSTITILNAENEYFQFGIRNSESNSCTGYTIHIFSFLQLDSNEMKWERYSFHFCLPLFSALFVWFELYFVRFYLHPTKKKVKSERNTIYIIHICIFDFDNQINCKKQFGVRRQKLFTKTKLEHKMNSFKS